MLTANVPSLRDCFYHITQFSDACMAVRVINIKMGPSMWLVLLALRLDVCNAGRSILTSYRVVAPCHPGMRDGGVNRIH